MFIETDELGHYNDKNGSICLYDVQNQKPIIDNIRKRIEQYTKNYTLIVLDKKEEITNINILDIDL